MSSGPRRPVLRRVGTSASVVDNGARWCPVRDAGPMTPGDRLAELGEILAAGYRRRRKALAERDEPEAPSDPVVDA